MLQVDVSPTPKDDAETAVQGSLPGTASTSSETEAVSSPPKPAEDKVYNIEFTFDADVRCAITIYYFCTEELHSHGVLFTSKRKELTSETYEYRRGSAQVFSQPAHKFYPSQYVSDIEAAAADPEIISIAIQCVSLEGDTPRQSHATIGLIEKYSDSSFVIKGLKQKLFIDGLSYLLQEIYGLENKSVETSQFSEDDVDDCGAECVVCMCDLRDTIILPCRHLCLCNACADSLRYQANNCPICRAPFRALLQIRAVQKIGQVTHPALPDPDASNEGIPPGYQCVSLVEALNGPITAPPPPPPPAIPHVPKEKKRKSRSGKSSSSSSSANRGGGAAAGASSSSNSRSHAGSAPKSASGSRRVPTAAPEDDYVEPPLGDSPVSEPIMPINRRNISLSIVSEVGSSSPLVAARSKKGSTSKSPSHSSSLNVPSSSKESPVASSVDLVDEELAKMSANPSITGVGPSPPPPASNAEPEATPPLAVPEIPTVEDIEEEEGEADNLIGHDEDEAVVVNLTSVGGAPSSSRVSIPGTPTSNMSARSSQDSSASSTNSTKQLLPPGAAGGVKTTTCPPVIVKVNPTSSQTSLRDEEEDDEAEEC